MGKFKLKGMVRINLCDVELTQFNSTVHVHVKLLPVQSKAFANINVKELLSQVFII